MSSGRSSQLTLSGDSGLRIHILVFFWRSLNLAVVSWQSHGLTSSLARDVNCFDSLGTCCFGLDAIQTFTLVVPVHRRNCLT